MTDSRTIATATLAWDIPAQDKLAKSLSSATQTATIPAPSNAPLSASSIHDHQPDDSFEVKAPVSPEVQAVVDQVTPSPYPQSSLAKISEMTQADRDARYFSLSLPSNFYWYPFKKLTASLITGVQQMKLERAANQDSSRFTVEAVTSALGDGVNAMDLTLQDFYYVMYWLRLASYTKFDFDHVAICRHPDHLRDVAEKKKPATSLKTVTVLKSTQITETPFVPFEISEELKASGLRVGPARMSDVVDLSEMDIGEAPVPGKPKKLDPKAEETIYFGDLACYLDPVQMDSRWNRKEDGEIGKGLTLEQRMDLVRGMSGDLIRELQGYIKKVNAYGVAEFINVRCKGCGAEVRSEVRVSASDFL